MPTRIWTSPLVRAVQTAELVVSGLACETQVEIVADLAPDASARELTSAVRSLPSDTAVMLVGHEPSLSAIGGLIVGGPDFEALDKAEAARIVDGVLRWRFAWDAEAPTVIAGKP